MNSIEISALLPDGGSGGWPFSSDHLGESIYKMGVVLGALFLLFAPIALLCCYLCSRATSPLPPPPLRPRQPPPLRLSQPGLRSLPPLPRPRGEMSAVADFKVGIDEDTVMKFPKVLYSEAKLRDKGTTTTSCCSICLADYKDDDELRGLPDCGHLFHLKCVDPWLRLHPTCPFCRTSLLPSPPLSTPSAEVVPLARQQQQS